MKRDGRDREFTRTPRRWHDALHGDELKFASFSLMNALVGLADWRSGELSPISMDHLVAQIRWPWEAEYLRQVLRELERRGELELSTRRGPDAKWRISIIRRDWFVAPKPNFQQDFQQEAPSELEIDSNDAASAEVGSDGANRAEASGQFPTAEKGDGPAAASAAASAIDAAAANRPLPPDLEKVEQVVRLLPDAQPGTGGVLARLASDLPPETLDELVDELHNRGDLRHPSRYAVAKLRARLQEQTDAVSRRGQTPGTCYSRLTWSAFIEDLCVGGCDRRTTLNKEDLCHDCWEKRRKAA